MAALKWWDWWRCVWMRVSNNDGGAKEETTSPSNPGSAMLLGELWHVREFCHYFSFCFEREKNNGKELWHVRGWMGGFGFGHVLRHRRTELLSLILACGHRFAVPDVFPFFFFLFFTQKP